MHVTKLLLHRKIPSLKQRIAGRSLPIEKFVINKAERYLQGEALPLCGLVSSMSSVAMWWYRCSLQYNNSYYDTPVTSGQQ